AARAEHELHCLPGARHAADPPPPLAAAGQIVLPAGGRGFIWIAAEAGVARALRDHFAGPRSHPRGWIKAAGYWIEGQADASDKTLD
ncbi:SIP domain-containing protein, partial [Paenirhodobacter enshiensis]|uniref:SIP domain-containing protein n=1 Tax=Paenirhodobacter enshiensis TaxID=1105367 RepID=UPI003FA2CF76